MRIHELFEGDFSQPVHQKHYRGLANKYPAGETEIWYARDPNTPPRPRELAATHVLVGKVSETDPNKIFAMMQAEIWSAQGEADDMLHKLGLKRTSMEPDDVIKMGDRVLMVTQNGFEDISAPSENHHAPV